MNNSEFKNEFDISYNNIRSNKAPNIDNYELSVFLTKAQDEIVFNTYNPMGNKYQDGFENSEKRRGDLKQLVKSFKTIPLETDINEESINGYKSVSVELPLDVYFIIQEQASIDDIFVGVIPISHDELMLQKDNPFRKPSSDKLFNRVWRLDNNINDTYLKSLEIVLPLDSVLEEYRMRYIKSPRPIIIEDINEGEFAGLGLTIKGQTTKTTCELDEIVHRQILDRAVSLALEAFEQQRLQTQTQISSRNE